MLIDAGLLPSMIGSSPIDQLATHPWNLRVDKAPRESSLQELSMLTAMWNMDKDKTEGEQGRLWYDFGIEYGIPYCCVTRDQAREIVTFNYDDESDYEIGGLVGYPIPVEARTDARYIENKGRTDGDQHLLILQRDDMYLYELSYAQWTGSAWIAGAGAMWDLKKNDYRPMGWTSTDAAGMQVLPGLVRYDEAYGPDPIRHGFRFAVNTVNGKVWPATHIGSNDTGGIPLGTRIRLKGDFDIDGYIAAQLSGFSAVDKAAMAKIL